jgi:hypothetical protein
MRTATSIMLLGGVLALAAGPAAAQNANPAPEQRAVPAPDRAPPESSGSSTGPGNGSAGEDLARSHGVITPPATGDQSVVPPPRAGGQSMPVIPPPGTPGGNQDVQPR